MNPEEQLRAGLAMLANPASANEWRQAIALLESAASEGFAEAIERRAVFECMGVGRAPNWEKAIASLRDAAERGSESAAGQLRVLDGSSIESRLAARQGQTLSSNPLIRTISGFASTAECAWLMSTAAGRLQRAIIYNKATGEQAIDAGRTNQQALFNFAHLDVIVEMLRTRIANAISAPMPCLEITQVLRYGPGEEFAPHCDFLDPVSMASEIRRRGQRAATILIYLNEEFEGGETSFPELGIEHRGKSGDALVFSNVTPAGHPEPRTIHAGRPPVSGVKWILSQWVRDRAPA